MNTRDPHPKRSPIDIGLAILSVCRQAYREVHGMLYSKVNHIVPRSGNWKYRPLEKGHTLKGRMLGLPAPFGFTLGTPSLTTAETEWHPSYINKCNGYWSAGQSQFILNDNERFKKACLIIHVDPVPRWIAMVRDSLLSQGPGITTWKRQIGPTTHGL